MRIPTYIATLALTVAPAPLLAQGVAVASQAQVSQIDKRVGTLESQMRAVQRQVFPGGDKRFFAPEITPEQAPAPQPAGAPATTPLVDLTQRVTALETQQRELTGQVEQLQYKLRQMEEAMGKLRGDTEFRLNALEKGPAAPPTETAAIEPAPAPKPAVATPKPAAPKPAEPAPAAAAADPEEAYRQGYELYTKGQYAEAEAKLTAFVAANPKHARASNAQFWAGRALLAQGKTPEAAKAFLAGYQKFPKGERAHNSLLYLGKSLVDMKQPKAACQALDQLKTAYPDRLSGAFAADVDKTRTAAGCPG